MFQKRTERCIYIYIYYIYIYIYTIQNLANVCAHAFGRQVLLQDFEW